MNNQYALGTEFIPVNENVSVLFQMKEVPAMVPEFDVEYQWYAIAYLVDTSLMSITQIYKEELLEIYKNLPKEFSSDFWELTKGVRKK